MARRRPYTIRLDPIVVAAVVGLMERRGKIAPPATLMEAALEEWCLFVAKAGPPQAMPQVASLATTQLGLELARELEEAL